MGLLDSLFSNDASGGGLLDFIRNNALNQQFGGGLPSDQAQYGAPANTMAQAPILPQQNAPQPPAAPQQPPAVIPAQQQTPSPLPQPATQPSQPQSMPPPAQPSGPGIGDRISSSLQSFANSGGPLPAIANGITSLMTGQRTDPTGVAQQQAAQTGNLTARALIAKGVDPQIAITAVQPGNTEMLKTLVTQTFGPKTVTSLGNGYAYHPDTGKTTREYEPDDKFQHVNIKNPDGSETPQAFDPSTGKYSGAPPAPAGRFAVDDSLTGQARMDALKAADPDYARRIQSMVNGDIPLPTGVAALKPNADRMIKDVLAVDGSTSASDFATRAATRKDYASGIASRVTKSINTTIGHFATLDQSIDKLGNYTYFPSVSNAIHDAYGSNLDPAYQKAKATFETNKEAAVKELDFALSGGHSSVSGSAELREKFNRADSPDALHAAVTEAMSLLEKRLQSHAKAFNEGTKSQRDEQDFLYPENRTAFNKLTGSQDTSTGQPVPGISGAAPTGSASTKPATVTQNGHTYNLQPDGSYK